jgi:hypothetical protein
MPATRAQLERRLAAHRRAAATHRRASVLHAQAVEHARRFGDDERELKEIRLQRKQEQGAMVEDELAAQAVIALQSAS